MPAYARVTTIDAEFGAKYGPDGVIACGKCHCNLAIDPLETVYIIYLNKRLYNANEPHNVFCKECAKTGFPRMVII